eukprot:2042319-Amphidinium_carterae.1
MADSLGFWPRDLRNVREQVGRALRLVEHKQHLPEVGIHLRRMPCSGPCRSVEVEVPGASQKRLSIIYEAARKKCPLEHARRIK